MKKVLFSVLIMGMTTGMMSVTAYAHGGQGHGCGRGDNRQAQYAVCAVEECAQAGLHQHDGTYYYCTNHGAGCANHRG